MNDLLRKMLEETFGNSGMGGELITRVLGINVQKQFPAAWNAMTTVYDRVMVPLAIGIMLIWFVCSLLEKTTHEDFSFEKWFFEFGKLIVCQYLIVHGLELLTVFMSIGIALLKQMQNFGMGNLTEFNPDNLSHTVWHIITGKDWSENLSFVQSLGYMVLFLLPFLGSLIAKIIIFVIAFSRVFELILRGAVAPLAFSDFFAQGMQGAGFKFLKSFFAVAIQGVIIFIILMLLDVIMIDVLATQIEIYGSGTTSYAMGGFLSIYFGVYFAAVSLIIKSLSFAKELVGVN